MTGKAKSWQEQQLAERVAKSVRGVRAVDNQIDVEYFALRSDSDIRADIESRLRWDALVEDRLLSAHVEKGAVRLAGHVGTSAEKWRAASDAWVAGVKSVDESRLDVRPWAERPELVSKHYPRLSDKQIVRAIEDAARHDPRVEPSAIQAEVRAGFVALRGSRSSLSRSALRFASRYASRLGRRDLTEERMLVKHRVHLAAPSSKQQVGPHFWELRSFFRWRTR